MCETRQQKVNAGKSKVLVLEAAREQVMDFKKPYRVKAEG